MVGTAPEFEFMGPTAGPLGMVLGLPAVCYGLFYACNAGGCLGLSQPGRLLGFPPAQRLFTWQALAVYLAWFACQAALHLLLPGRRAQGTKLPDGTQLTYKLNGEWAGGRAGVGGRVRRWVGFACGGPTPPQRHGQTVPTSGHLAPLASAAPAAPAAAAAQRACCLL